MNKIKYSMLAGVLCVLALPVNAMIITFDFRTNNLGQNQQTYTYSQGGVNLSVEAWSTVDDLATRSRQDIRSNNSGIGVEGLGSTQINTSGFPDVAEWLAFSADIGEIVSVGIGRLGPGEEADLWASSAANIDLTPGNFQFLSTVNGVGSINPQFEAVNTGTLDWLLVASSVPVQSGFRVATIDVYLTESGMPVLFLIGLAGLVWSRRLAAAR